ncbi:class I SAM-dependent methyltransferase [Candidatus Woesearchaeota archaeon]|nr:class I SAM-dependent methyltransferase [Candidatus Woesearchaeota archaeon]
MNSKLERILRLVQENPVEFTRFSGDLQQINPESRVVSISNILERVKLPEHSTILDIGTGYGYGAVLLSALGYNVMGVELNRDKLEEGMDYWKRLGIDFEQTEDLSLATSSSGKLYFSARDSKNLGDIPNQSIDMVTAFYISGYMTGEKGAFREVGRILDEHGNFTMTTEGPIQLPQFLRGLAVNLASRFLGPSDLRLTSRFTINDSQVYDKFVLVYDKA